MKGSPTQIIADYTASAPVDLVGMITALGLKLQRDAGLPSDIAGKLQRDSNASSGFRIVVNSNDNAGRQRFTLAHEIAHFVLHRDLLKDGLVDDALYRSAALSDEYERQADRFAAQILLPGHSVRAAYKVTRALAPLAAQFEVSVPALRIRLNELGLGA